MFFTYFVLVVLPALSLAGQICEPLSQLHDEINFCSANPGYIPPAKACRDGYRSLVERKNAEIRKILAGQLANAKDEAQNLKFGTTQTTYATTEAILTTLINQGNQVLAELGAYGDDFVPPIPSWAAGYFIPNRKDPSDPARQPENYCYAEPMTDLDAILADVQSIVNDLVATRTKTIQLHQNTSIRDAGLVELSEVAGNPSPTVPGVSGKSMQGASTVTGRIASDSLPDPKEPAKLAKQKLPVGGSVAHQPAMRETGTITGGNLATGKPAMPSPSIQAQVTAAAAGRASANVETSSGSLIWNEPKDSNGINLELNLASAHDRSPASATDAAYAEMGIDDIAVAGGGDSRRLVGTEHVKNSALVLVAGDTTLFEAVSRCYRKSKLFRLDL